LEKHFGGHQNKFVDGEQKEKMLDKQGVVKSFQNAQTKNVSKLNLYVIGEVLKYQNIHTKNVNG